MSKYLFVISVLYEGAKLHKTFYRAVEAPSLKIAEAKVVKEFSKLKHSWIIKEKYSLISED